MVWRLKENENHHSKARGSQHDTKDVLRKGGARLRIGVGLRSALEEPRPQLRRGYKVSRVYKAQPVSCPSSSAAGVAALVCFSGFGHLLCVTRC